jgi:hypothetical protein
MKRILKWAALVVGVVLVLGFGAFLYFIPPFYTTPPEEFIKQTVDAAPKVDAISDPKERLLAERGREIVLRSGCNGCHAPIGPQGPDFARFLAGGSYKTLQRNGTYVSRNLTSDKDTGLARRSNEEVLKVLRSGVFPDGHVSPMSAMPWPVFSNWTEEDRYAVLTFLRHVPAIPHKIPEAVLTPNALDPGLVQKDVSYHDDAK